MIEVQYTARNAAGDVLAYTLGMGRNYAAAKAAALVGMRARLAADKRLVANVRTFEVEAL